jgi:PAS domain S-box-containing protein
MAASTPVDYQHIFRSLPGLFLLLAPDGTVLDNSDQHVDSALLPREQAMGRNIFEAYPSAPESQHALADSHEKVRRTLQPDTMPLLRYDLERPAELGGGTEERYWQLTHYPILDARGELQYILQQPQDVTAQHLSEQRRQQAEQELAEAQESARFTLDALPVLVNTTDASGQPIFFNQRWLTFTGLSPAELMADWSRAIHSDDLERLSREWEQTRNRPDTTQYEYRVRRADGQYRWIMTRSVPRFDAAGQVVQRVGGGVDIHEQKLMVQELLDASEQQATLSEQTYLSAQLVQQQRQTFFDLLMHAPAYISIVRGAEHRYEFANLLFMELVNQQQVVGRTVAEVFPEIVSQGIVAMLDQVFRTGEPATGTELLVRVDNGRGELRDAYFNFIYQRFEENGAPAGITAYSYEVTELVQLRQALERASQAPAKTDGAAPLSVH